MKRNQEPRIRKMKWGAKVLFALAGLAIFAFSYYLGNQYAKPRLAGLSARVLDNPVSLAQLDLTDKNGESFNAGSFSPYWNLLIAGDHESDACKALITRYVYAWNRLAHIPQLQKITRVIFLPLTSDNLPPAQLKHFIEFYNPDFTSVTGNKSNIRYLADQLGLPVEAGHNQIYCGPSNSVVGLVDPQGYLVALFTQVKDPRVIAHDLEFLAH